MPMSVSGWFSRLSRTLWGIVAMSEPAAADTRSAAELLERTREAVAELKLMIAKAVVGLFPANSVGDDIELYADDKRKKVMANFHTLRQQVEKVNDNPYYALSDFIAPKDSRVKDYLGGFAVTTGIGLDAIVERYKKDHDDYQGILATALADRLAEAFAERMHELTRKELWGYAPDEDLDEEAFMQCRYRGIRPAPGYPACPDHTEKVSLFELLDTVKSTGIYLTENYAMSPASSVSGIYFAHPESKYFALGAIDRDQVEEYAARKNMSVKEIEKWLSPNLGYKP